MGVDLGRACSVSLATMRTLNRLRVAREARGLSLRDVAELAGIDAGQLSRIETGKSGLTVEVLLRLARTLGLKDLARVVAPFVESRGEHPNGQEGRVA